MRRDLMAQMMSLTEQKIPFAHASIVRRMAPSSGKPGDHALITQDGMIYGWIGGGCTKGIVLKEALLSLQDRKSRYVSISNEEAESSFSNTKIYSMTCQSGGQVEVYIEPIMPKPHIVVIGKSHIGMGVCRLAKQMDYQVSVIMNAADPSVYPSADHVIDIAAVNDLSQYNGAYVVVCSQGEGDITALLKGLQLSHKYIGFVASRMKAQSVYTDLRKHGITFEQLKEIVTPAGIDIGGKLPEEVAVSILAQIVQKFRQAEPPSTQDSQELSSVPNDDFYLNPVCNIPIQKSTAKYVIQHQGESVYFCCDGCKISFEKDPSKYIPISQ